RRILNKNIVPSLQRLIIAHKSSAGHGRLGQPGGKGEVPPQGTAPISPLFSRAQFLVCFGAGQQDSSGYSLAKEGWPRHQGKWSRSLGGAAGVVRSTSDNRWLEPTTPSAPQRWLRSIFLMAQPPLLLQGNGVGCCFALQCQMLGCPLNDVICSCQMTQLPNDQIVPLGYWVVG